MKKLLLALLLLNSSLLPLAAQRSLLPAMQKAASQSAQTAAAKAGVTAPKTISSWAQETGLSSEILFSPITPRSRNERLWVEDAKQQASKRVAEPISIVNLRSLHSSLMKDLQRHKTAAFDAHALEMTANLQNPFFKDMLSIAASAFFVEEIYQGKRYLWAVTAEHILDALGPDMRLYITLPEGFTLDFPIEVAAKGNAGMADIALLKIPEEAAQIVRPIPLSQTEVKKNEVLRSYGFFNQDFHIVYNRRVREATPSRIVTSFEYGNIDRAGACGGPLLNENNELVGIHCGSSPSKQESYAVPVSFLRDLMASAHQDTPATRDLVLNGEKIGTIAVDEYIYKVRTLASGITLYHLFPWRQEKRVDYNHLEKLISLNYADKLEIIIIKGGTMRQHTPDQTLIKKRLTIHLKTGKTVLEEI